MASSRPPAARSTSAVGSAASVGSPGLARQAIRIACRVRPFLSDELSAMLAPPEADDIECSERTISVLHKAAKHKYQFSSVHGPEATQKDVFAADVAPLLDSVYQGVSTTVFSYGMTGSGKTHTMSGDPRSAADMGIIPRTVKALFLKRARLRKAAITISFEFLEIYKDECFDLLAPKNAKPKALDIRTNDVGANIVAGLVRTEIMSPQEFEELYAKASAHRRTERTLLNEKSSRSHAVLSIHVRTEEVKEGGKIWTGKINLIDLAGSENNKLTGNDRERLAESSAINKSLTTLGNVIDALNKGHSRVPYRDSKLTRVLADTLGGSAVGLLICNISPRACFRQDTINTLNFAIRTKEVENRVTVDEREHRPPAAKPHFASLSKAMHLSAPPSRPMTAMAPARALVVPVSTKKTVVPAGRAFGTDVKNVASEARPRTASSGKPGVVIGRGGPTVVKGSVKGKGRQVEEVDVEALVKTKVAEELERQMADFKRTLQASANDSLVAPKDDLLDARIEYLERAVKAQVEKSTAEDMLDHARRHHDRAFQQDDRVQLEIALDFYRQALVYLPGKRAIMTRIHDIQQAIALGLPVPPRKGAPKVDDLADDQPVAGPSRSPSALGSLPADAVRAKALPRSFKAAPTKKGSTLNIFADPPLARLKDVDAIDIIALPTPPPNPLVVTAKPKAKPVRKAVAVRLPTTAGTLLDNEADIDIAGEIPQERTKRPRTTRAATGRSTRRVYRESVDSSEDDDLGGLSDADGEWMPT